MSVPLRHITPSPCPVVLLCAVAAASRSRERGLDVHRGELQGQDCISSSSSLISELSCIPTAEFKVSSNNSSNLLLLQTFGLVVVLLARHPCSAMH